MKIKSKISAALTILLISSFVMSGCDKGNTADNPTSSEVTSAETSNEIECTVNNLIDKQSQEDVDKLLSDAGISKERRNVFWEHVNQVNSTEGFNSLKAGNRLQQASKMIYDPYELQDFWNKAHPDFVGYNCRITAFSLMGDYIEIKNTGNYNDSDLFMDIEALTSDPSALQKTDDMERFKTLYSTYDTENSKDINVHLALVQEKWKQAGISFKENSSASLISMYFHNQFSETENELSIGHTGVLIDMGKKGLCFVEKLAFQEPYDVVYVKNRKELSDYLMAKYNTDYNQPTAAPFIVENDQLMDSDK